MATESVPAGPIIAFDNMTMASAASIIGVTSEATLYPKSNLTSPLRSKRWRSVGAVAQNIDFDLGSDVAPTVFALIDSNLPLLSTIVLKTAADSAFTTSVLTWTFTAGVYQQSSSHVLRWYLGSDDSSTVNSGSRYWRVQLPDATASNTYHELGLVWLGNYSLLRADFGSSNKLSDNARIAQAYSGARYTDTARIMHEIDVSAGLLGSDEWANMMLRAEVNGTTIPALVDMHAYETSDGTIKRTGTYYGTLDPRAGFGMQYKFSKRSDVRLSFTESVA